MSKLDFSDLERPSDLLPGGNVPDRKTYPCVHCAGTGKKVIGYTNVREVKCTPCRGKGYFLTSPKDRKSASATRAKAGRKREERRDEKRASFIKEYAPIVQFLNENRGWSSYCADLLDVIDQYGSLTEAQLRGVESMALKCAQKAAERVASKAAEVANKPVLNMTKVLHLFAKAMESGVKKPALYVGCLRLAFAPNTGRNAGCIYVKDEGEYAGKIGIDGKFYGIRDSRRPQTVIEQELIALVADPLGRMAEHGRATGICSCCGRKLTNEESVTLGIGPICRSQWGL